MRERTRLQETVSDYLSLEREFEDTVELAEICEEEGDIETLDEAENTLEAVRLRVKKMELESLLSGEVDRNDCYLEIHAGAGGTESQDWAEMLLRMYARWITKSGRQAEWIEQSSGDEAGIKSVTIKVIGALSYGWLKTEGGVHRLVRISPYDSNARRHTSFASVWVFPVIDDTINVQIEDKELRIDTYRASGAGGQHVNRTDSAVRITHIPSNIVVQCQAERSQHRNRAAAMSMLRARLYEAELQRREQAAQDLNSQKTEIGWGRQIRSYVLQPYRLVKDLRTNLENTNPEAVLDGDLDSFMAAALAQQVGVLGQDPENPKKVNSN